jgi:glutamate-1-semialdehyde 2,1-aminomutase
MAAGLATLEALESARAYEHLESLGRQLETGLNDAARAAGVAVRVQRLGSMFCAYFTDAPVWNLADALKADRQKFARFFHGMLERGIYLAPSQFEAGFLSTAHTPEDIERTVRTAAAVFKTL